MESMKLITMRTSKKMFNEISSYVLSAGKTPSIVVEEALKKLLSEKNVNISSETLRRNNEGDDMRTETFGVYIPNDLFERADLLAKQVGVARSKILLQAIADFFDDKKKSKKESQKKNIESLYEAFNIYSSLDDVTAIPDTDPRRKKIVDLGTYSKLVYQKVFHRCEQTDKDNVILTSDKQEQWAEIDEDGVVQNISCCPYCGLNLNDHKGTIVVLKANTSDEQWQAEFEGAMM